MNLFWIFCGLLIAVALLFVVLPLWRKSGKGNDVLRDLSNLEISRDQLAEMDADLRNGLLTQEFYDQAKLELQTRMLDEVKSTEQVVAPQGNNRTLAIVLAVLLPIFTFSLYLYLGNPSASLPLNEQVVAGADGVMHSEKGIQELEAELKKRPENPNGWFMLAQAYIAQQRYMDGSNAYAKLVKLVPNEAQVWANYADVYAMAHGKTLQNAEVAKMLEQALSLDGNNISALALTGSAGMERKDYAVAIINWQKLLNQLQPDSPDARRFVGDIQEARRLLAEQPGGNKKLDELDKTLAKLAPVEGMDSTTNNPAAAIKGKVSLGKALAGKVAPTDTVFILARAAQGPKMPLAVFRKQVKDLPLEFTLDDSMAMRPEMKLSGFSQVVVVARVSKSGTPMAQPGDFEGVSGVVKPGTNGLNLVIDSVVK